MSFDSWGVPALGIDLAGGAMAPFALRLLCEQRGNTVRLSYRGEAFSRIKEGNRKRIDEAAAVGV
jgi:hypothetical protein